jgi:pimeloyl-ACP methyl ester carboxylesterase
MAVEPQPLEFQLTYDRKVGTESFTGRVYVILDAPGTERLPEDIDWFTPQPLLAVDVKNWKPGETLVVGKDALACPAFEKIPAKEYSIHAVMDFDRGGMSFSAAPGNGYSKPLVRKLDPAKGGALNIVLDQVYKEPAFEEKERIKLVEMESALLTKFYGKSVKMRAGVSLPKSFSEQPNRRYPVIYDIPGFGGDHRAISFSLHSWTEYKGTEFIHVVLDPNCRTGHHEFVDSPTNGPVGRALTEEFIPFIEKKFRGAGNAGGRFVTGHSSGGWTSLWLQITYPDFFGGCWATAPDEVDFREFQRTNIYKEKMNFFDDENGKPRPMARDVGRGAIYNKSFSDLEIVIGHGGQLGSYEANFSSLDKNGRPRLLWDRKNGDIDAEIAKHWEQYDLRLVLERNWEKLGPKLKGKLHVYVGSKDTFFLEAAVGLLKESQNRLKSDAVIDIIPGRNHSTLIDDDLIDRIKAEMVKRYKETK